MPRKIKVDLGNARNKYLYHAVQQKAFDLGYSWQDQNYERHQECCDDYKEARYLFFGQDGIIEWEVDEEREFPSFIYHSDDYEKLTPMEFLKVDDSRELLEVGCARFTKDDDGNFYCNGKEVDLYPVIEKIRAAEIELVIPETGISHHMDMSISVDDDEVYCEGETIFLSELKSFLGI